jgi:hypothetical protein
MIMRVLLLAAGTKLFSEALMPEIHKRPILIYSDGLLAATRGTTINT